MQKYIAILTTCASQKEARVIAKKLLAEKLIACANISTGLSSFFWWKGKIDKASETLLIMKTAKGNFNIVRKHIRKIHSYEIPEIIALPIIDGDADYLGWIKRSVKA